MALTRGYDSETFRMHRRVVVGDLAHCLLYLGQFIA